jgi:hypothetical protein
MTIQRLRSINGFVVTCDNCDETVEQEDVEEFEDLVQILRGLGWSFWKSGQEWVHRCPTCKRR